MEGTSTDRENFGLEREQKGEITNALKYYENLLRNNNLRTSSPLNDISYASIPMAEQIHNSMLEILDNRQIIEDDELILIEKCEFKKFSKVIFSYVSNIQINVYIHYISLKKS